MFDYNIAHIKGDLKAEIPLFRSPFLVPFGRECITTPEPFRIICKKEEEVL